ncbi:MAG: ribosomal-processing cysteine protease Prp [Leptospirales bacterium]|nr:ribosomal-processing cysteine protease Prp [Leptospirales bacterium]
MNAPISVLVEGHAGGIKGSDTFCAAVSTLSMTMVLTLASTNGLEQKIEQRDGFLKTEAVIEESAVKRTEIILEFFLTGMAELAGIEPQRIAVSFN